MRRLPQLFADNARWAARMTAQDPHFFETLVHQQAPEFLWIGCSDSRVPANEIVGRLPGQMFVHRNVANVVVHTDLNCLSVLQFAVDVLQVRHVIVCGHYGCGGVGAALERTRLGLVDNWLRHVRDVADLHAPALRRIRDASARHDRLCELNVAEQVRHVCETTIVQDAWRRRQPLTVHGWIYRLADGRLRDLGLCIDRSARIASIDRARPGRMPHALATAREPGREPTPRAARAGRRAT